MLRNIIFPSGKLRLDALHKFHANEALESELDTIANDCVGLLWLSTAQKAEHFESFDYNEEIN